MEVAQTFSGFEARLKSRGLGRFVDAAFLSVWLVFWAAGEAFVFWILGVGAWSLLTYELMRVRWARDRVLARSTGLEVTRRAGLWSRTRGIPREQLRNIYRLDAGSSV